MASPEPVPSPNHLGSANTPGERNEAVTLEPMRARDNHWVARELSPGEVYDRITAATNRLTDIRVDPFDGNDELNVVDWLEGYEDMALARRWNELARK